MLKITFMAREAPCSQKMCRATDLCPGSEGLEIALYDIDAERLDDSKVMLQAINRKYASKAKIKTYPRYGQPQKGAERR